jgi:hypothetical protein
MPRTVRAIAVAAALAGAHALTIEQAPAGLRLRGGIDLGKVAQGITGVFKGSEQKAAETKSATGELRLKGGEVSTCFDLLFCSSFVWACYF